MIENRMVDGLRLIEMQQKREGSKVDQGEECGSALLASIVFDRAIRRVGGILCTAL
jgi:hypothetical protein